MSRPRNGRGKSVWDKILGDKPVNVFQREKIVVERIAAVIGVDDMIRARFTGTLHVVFEKGLPRLIKQDAAPRTRK
jgi:hypothetical protein